MQLTSKFVTLLGSAVTFLMVNGLYPHQHTASSSSVSSQKTLVRSARLVDSISTRFPILLPSLRYGIDTAVSPCDDFDRFVNGSWRDSATIPTDAVAVNVFEYSADRTISYIRTLLASTPKLARTTTDPAITAVGRYYESCLTADTLERSLAALSMAGAAPADTARASRCSRLVMRDLPDATGYLFSNALLPGEAEQRVRAMVANIKRAAGMRIDRLTWMNPDDKKRVHQTLNSMTLRVAKPDVIIDHAALQLTTDNFEHNRKLIQGYLLKRQIVRTATENNQLWSITQYTANAFYRKQSNTIEVPAFMFQWPFFDDGSDETMAYAVAGAIIGHEMYHGVTGSAALTEDTAYTSRRDQLIKQYSSLPPMNSVPVKGEVSVLENLPDLGGLLAAYDAWDAAGYSKSTKTIDGFLPAQRFFVHFARLFRAKDTKLRLENMRPHAPGYARVNGTLANIPAFARAFGCREGSPMVRSPLERVDIW